MVEISSKALGGGSPALGGLTGLLSGLSQGLVQGRQLAQQENLIRLQREAAERADRALQAQERNAMAQLGLQERRLTLYETEAQRQRAQEERDKEVIGRSADIIASARDSEFADQFAAFRKAALPAAKAGALPFGSVLQSVLEPQSRTALRKAQLSSLTEAMQGGSVEVQKLLLGQFQGAVTQAEEDSARRKYANDAKLQMKSWAQQAAEIGAETPEIITGPLEPMLSNPMAFTPDQMAQGLMEASARFGLWYGPERTRFQVTSGFRAAIDALPGSVDPAIKEMAERDLAMAGDRQMSTEELNQRRQIYERGHVPIFHGGQLVGEASSMAQAKTLYGILERTPILGADKLQAELEKTQAETELTKAQTDPDWWMRRTAHTGAQGKTMEQEVFERANEIYDANQKISPREKSIQGIPNKTWDDAYQEAYYAYARSHGLLPEGQTQEDRAAQGFMDAFGAAGFSTEPEVQGPPVPGAPAKDQIAKPTSQTYITPPPSGSERGAKMNIGMARFGFTQKARYDKARRSNIETLKDMARRVRSLSGGDRILPNPVTGLPYTDAERDSMTDQAMLALEEATRQFSAMYGGLSPEEMTTINALRWHK